MPQPICPAWFNKKGVGDDQEPTKTSDRSYLTTAFRDDKSHRITPKPIFSHLGGEKWLVTRHVHGILWFLKRSKWDVLWGKYHTWAYGCRSSSSFEGGRAGGGFHGCCGCLPAFLLGSSTCRSITSHWGGHNASLQREGLCQSSAKRSHEFS